MTVLYNRSYELIFGTPFQFDPNSFSIFTTPQERLTQIENFLGQQGPNAVKLDAHNLSFDIRKTKKSSTNKSYIEVWNMSDRTIEYLANQQGLKPAVIFKAGYNDNPVEIFRGQLEYYVDRKEGENRVTKLFLSDGAENAREANTARSYRKGTPVSTMISDLLDDLGLPRAGGGVLLPDNLVAKKSIYFSGRTSDGLSRLAAGRLSDLADWTITDMHSYFLPSDLILPPETIVPLSENSGMIGSPVISDDTSGAPTYKQDGSRNSTRNIKVKSLLNGSLIPLKGIDLDSEDYKGTFKIADIRHRGTLEGSDWVSEMVVEEVPEES